MKKVGRIFIDWLGFDCNSNHMRRNDHHLIALIYTLYDSCTCMIHLDPGHIYVQSFTCFQVRTSVYANVRHLLENDVYLPKRAPVSSIKTQHESAAEPPAPLHMTIVWSARVQSTTTSAPKLDLPLSPLTMGCWDAITKKNLPPLHLATHTYTPIH